jgi:single-strand selective monofunctional uracil DNA glycosylase
VDLIRTSRALARDLAPLSFGDPVAHVYNPLDYARRPFERYARRYATPGCPVLLIGMNPGPWGMAQTGVPFGEVTMARDWLNVEAPLAAPADQHPARPIIGFACPRREVSGARLWGWAKARYRTPTRFFKHFFVANYCPLCFLEAGGRNRTPDKLPAREQAALFDACDLALRRTVAYLRPRFVVGVGAFAEGRARAALGGADVTIGRILHPSPASPAANRGWARTMERQLRALGVRLD